MVGEQEYGRAPLPAHLSPRGPAGPRPGKARRVLGWTAVSLALIVLVGAGLTYAYYRKLDGNVRRIDALPRNITHPPKVAGAGENILLVGSDSRVGASADQLAQAHTTGDGGGLNTDTIIVVHIAPDGGPVTMISFPRDSFVPIPGHGTFKINSAYADGEADHPGGGPALLAQTIESLSGIHLDHYIEVNFFQFIDISNAIGGVPVCLTAPAHDSYSGIDLPAGTSTVSGAQALAFVRQRHGLPAGDLDRIKRQQRFTTALVHKAENIRNPLTLNALLEKVTSSLTVDKGASGLDLVRLGERLKNVKPANIHFVTVPVANANASMRLPSGQYVSYVKLDEPATTSFFANIRAGRDPYAVAPSAPAVPNTLTTTAPALPAADVSVLVFNGRRTTGAAALGRRLLVARGFTVTGIADAPLTSQTTIRYGPGHADSAAAMASAVPGAALVQDDALGATIQLVLGTDGLRVSESDSPTPAPTSADAPSSGTTQTAETTADSINCGV